MKNVIDTIAAQYANSPTLRQLIDSMNQYFDPSTDFEAFYDYVWNVDTGRGFGLDIWGKIVNISRDLTIPDDESVFGFKEDEGQPFDQATFYNSDAITKTYRLEDDAYRALILTKALANISASTPASLNQLLRNLFKDRGRCYVKELGGMKIQFVFEFFLAPYEVTALKLAIPNPAGVRSDILQVAVGSTLGFAEAGAQTFGNGVFYNPMG